VVQAPAAEDGVRQRVLPAIGVQDAVGKTPVHRIPRLVCIDRQVFILQANLDVLKKLGNRLRVLRIAHHEQKPLLLGADGEICSPAHPQITAMG
jgi:hypothetical protein